MQFLQWYSQVSRERSAGVRKNRCNPREMFSAIDEIFLQNPQDRVGTFPKRSDLNLSRVLASVPNCDGDGGRRIQERGLVFSQALVEGELLLLLLLLFLLFLFPSFTYHFGFTLLCFPVPVYLSVWLIKCGESSEAGEMVDLAANLNKYGHSEEGWGGRVRQRLARHRLEMRE